MAGTHRVTTTAALIVCLAGGPWVDTIFANENEPAPVQTPLFSTPPSTLGRSLFTLTDQKLLAHEPAAAAGAQAWRGTFNFIPDDASSYAQRRGRGGRGGYGGGRRNAAVTSIALGAVASIAGAAVLVYANRPECRGEQRAQGCGYGTKVAGGAVLSAGVVGLFVGALTW